VRRLVLRVCEITECWSAPTSTTASRASIPLRADGNGRLFGRRPQSTRCWTCCSKKVRFDPKSLTLVQRYLERAMGPGVAHYTCVLAAGSRRSSRPSPSYSTRSRWRWCCRQRRRERWRGGRGGRLGARALPRAEGRGAGRACGLADARSGRACFCAQHDRFALPLQQLALSAEGPRRVRSQVRYVARAKCKNCIGTSLSIPHSSALKVSYFDFDVASGRTEFLSSFQDSTRAGTDSWKMSLSDTPHRLD
jgi:hypothetical protein